MKRNQRARRTDFTTGRTTSTSLIPSRIGSSLSRTVILYQARLLPMAMLLALKNRSYRDLDLSTHAASVDASFLFVSLKRLCANGEVQMPVSMTTLGW